MEDENFRFELKSLLDVYSIVEIAFVMDFIQISKEENSFIYNVQQAISKGFVKNYCFGEYNSILPLNLAKRLKMDLDYLNKNSASPENIIYFYEFINSFQYMQGNTSLRLLFDSGISPTQAEKLLKPEEWIKYLNQDEELYIYKSHRIFDGVLA